MESLDHAANCGFDHVAHGAGLIMADGRTNPNPLVWSNTCELDKDVAWCVRGALHRPMPASPALAA